MKAWYVAATKTYKESLAEDNLRNQNFEVYLPRIKTETAINDETKTRYEPLFPGYIFVRFDPNERSAGTINSTRGILRLISFGTKLAELKTHYVEHLIERVDKIEPKYEGTKFLKRGEKVDITDGPFEGLEAVFKQKSGKNRSMLLIKLLSSQQEISVPNSFFK